MLSRTKFLLPFCLGLTGPAGAESIVQDVSMHFADHGTTFGYYRPFDPSLGPLGEVVIRVTGTAQSGEFAFTNNSDSPVTFTATIGIRLEVAGQPVNFTSTFTETLLPNHTDYHAGVGGGFDITSYYYPPLTESFEGPYPLGPNVQFGLLGDSDYATVSDPRITWSADADKLEMLNAGETVSYIYGAPEPPSLVLLGTAVVAGVGFTLCRRRRVLRQG